MLSLVMFGISRWMMLRVSEWLGSDCGDAVVVSGEVDGSMLDVDVGGCVSGRPAARLETFDETLAYDTDESDGPDSICTWSGDERYNEVNDGVDEYEVWSDCDEQHT